MDDYYELPLCRNSINTVTIQQVFQIDRYGRYQGTYEEWYLSGQQKEHIEYVDGEILGRRIAWDNHGVVLINVEYDGSGKCSDLEFEELMTYKRLVSPFNAY